MASAEPITDPEVTHSPRWALLTVLAVYLAFCAAYVVAIPPGYGPDEPLHANTVRLLAEEGRMPVSQGITQVATGGGHAFHPPLYYALEAPIYYLFRSSPGSPVSPACIRAMRLLSVILGTLALWQFSLFLRGLFPRQGALVPATVALVALLPEYLLVSSVVLNDIAAVLCGILLLRALAHLTAHPSRVRGAVYTGLALAAFANSKGQVLMLLPLPLGWMIALAVWKRLTWRQALRAVAVAYGLLLLLGSGWYVRNWTIYGSILPPGLEQWAPHAPDGHRLTPWELYSSGLLVQLVLRSAVGLWESLWAQVDWFMNPPPPGTVAPIPPSVPYALLGLACVLAVAGYARAWRARRRGAGPLPPDEESTWRARIIKLVYAQFLLLYLAVTYMAVFVHLGWYQGGRYLYPGIWAVGIFLVRGHAGLWPARERRLAWLAPALLVLLNVLCLFNMLAFLNPAYAGG
jgi:hypothetical protein